ALLLARDPEDPEGEQGRRRVLAHFKCNLATPAATLSREFQPTMIPDSADGPAVETATLAELGVSTHNGRDLLEQRADGEERSALDEAKDLLRTERARGARAA